MKKNNNKILIVMLSGIFVCLSNTGLHSANAVEVTDKASDTTKSDTKTGVTKSGQNTVNRKDAGEELRTEADAVATEATQIVY